MTPDRSVPPSGVFSPPRYGVGSYVPAVEPLVPAGERLLGVVDVRLSNLVRHTVPRRYRPAEPGARNPLARVLAPLVSLWYAAGYVWEGFWAVLRFLRGPVRGPSLRGGWESEAGRFAVAVRTGPRHHRGYDNAAALLAFTTRRVLVLYLGPGRKEAEALGEVLRERVREARDRHTWFSSRVDLCFADGSLVALEVERRRARALGALVRGAVPEAWA